MKNYRRLSILFCILAGLLVLTVPILQAQETVTLYDAIATGQIAVTIEGRSSTFIEPMVVMDISNLTSNPLYIDASLGSILSSDQDDYCDLVVLAVAGLDPTIYFPGISDTPTMYQLYTYCTELTSGSKRFPSAEATYSPTGNFASEDVIAVLRNIQNENGQETFAAQIAIWSAATGADLAQLQQEMGADYSLYEGPVNKYLGASLETPATTIGPTQQAITTPSVNTPTPTASPAASGSTYLYLAVAVILIVGGGVFFWFIRRKPDTSSAKKPHLARQPDISTNSEPVQTCPSCDTPYRRFDKGGGVCDNLRCSTNLRSSRVSLGSKREDTEPIPVMHAPSSTQQSFAPDEPKVKKEANSRPRERRHSPTEPTETETQSPIRHDQTEPIGVEWHQQTDPLRVEETAPEDDRLTLKVLQGSQKGQEYDLWGLEGVVSRGEAGQVTIDDSKVSTPHAILDTSHRLGGKDRIRDLGSKNGTHVNGNRLSSKWRFLNDGDVLQFGLTKMRYNRDERQLEYGVQGIEAALEGLFVNQPVDKHHPPVSLEGNNRWLITRRQVPFVEFKSTDTAISVPHVYLRCSNGRLEVRDISSGNGVHVQGRKIKGKEMVFNQEIFRIGRETEMQIITTISNIPEKIGDWIRQSWIGGGGMADVYRVQHKRDESIIRALKIPNPKKYRLNDKLGERYRELFERERNLSRKIHHSNLVLAHDDVGELEGSRLPYLVLDFIDGPSLDLLVEKLGTIAPNDVAEIVVQVGRAIKYLHAQHQHIHCDVKPGNILIDTSGQVFLSDLGIATPSGQNLPGLGVPDYLPREVIEGLPVGVDTDVYSLGQTMFHMLTAESLSKAQIEKRAGTQVINPIADPQKHSSAIITKLTQSSGARGALGQVIQRCIENKREKRYQRMDDLLQVVEPLCTGADLKALVAKSGWISSTS